MKEQMQHFLHKTWNFSHKSYENLEADNLTGKIKMSISHIKIWSQVFLHEIRNISYFSFENLWAVFPSGNIEYCLFNI